MNLGKAIAVPMLAVALLGLTGCGAGDLKLGQSAVVDLSSAGNANSTFNVTVTSVTEAPADVVAKYDVKGKLYFATVEAKLVDPSKVSGRVVGIHNNVYAKLSDGNYLDSTGAGPDECSGKPSSADQASSDFVAGKTVTVCVPVGGREGKDVVGVYVGSSDVNDGAGKVWALS